MAENGSRQGKKRRMTPRRKEIQRKILDMLALGVPTTKVCKEIMLEYKISERTFYRELDYAYEVIEKEFSESKAGNRFLLDFLLKNDRVFSEAWKIYTQAINTSGKIRALHLVNETIKNRRESLQSLGHLDTAALKTDQIIRYSWLGDDDDSGQESNVSAPQQTKKVSQ